MRKKHESVNPLHALIRDAAARRALARQSHEHFFAFYLPHYIKYGTAPFQKEIFALTEDESIPIIAITAFRNSAKSTIISLSYVLWAIVGIQQRKCIVLLAQTQRQAALLMAHIKYELEHNKLLIADLGPFDEGEGEWKNNALYLTKVGARIMAVSIEQGGIRGIRNGSYRPDLVICDDIENIASVATIESRDKTFDTLVSDVMPMGDFGTRIIFVGNLLHEDSVMMRLKREIESSNLRGVYRQYPLINDSGQCLWPQKFPTADILEEFRRMIPHAATFQREYLLKIITSDDVVIKPEWIKTWTFFPSVADIRFVATGIDLAISTRESADCTAMVSVIVAGSGKDFHIYVHHEPVNERLGFRDMLEKAKYVSLRLSQYRRPSVLYVEQNGYQQAAVEQLQTQGLPVTGVPVTGDKRARLSTISHLVEDGTVLFAPQGNEQLMMQLTGFGKERHDDLVDAFSMAVSMVMNMRGSDVSSQDMKKPIHGDSPRERRFWRPDHSSDYGGSTGGYPTFGNISDMEF